MFEEKKLIREGNEKYKAKFYEQAEKYYSNALEIKKDYDKAIFNRANAEYKLKKYDKAVNDFQSVFNNTESEISKSDIAYQIGNSYIQKNFMLDSILSEISQNILSTTINPNENINSRVQKFVFIDSLSTVETALLQKKDSLIKEGIETYKKSLRLNPQDDDCRYNLAYAQALLKKNQDEFDKKNKKDNNDMKPSPFALKLKKKAEDFVKEKRYMEAYSLLHDGLKKDKTVSKYDNYMKRIKDVIESKAKQQE